MITPVTHSAARSSRLWWEIAIVLGLSLGASAVYSIVSIIARTTAGTALAEQTASINQSQATREWLDFTYQFLAIAFALFPVALAIYLLWTPRRSGFAAIGLTVSQPVRDFRSGMILLAAIGIPGLALYAAGRALGITVAVVPAPIDTFWWTIPILILAALRAALVEEVIVIGYLFSRLRQVGWSPRAIILSTAVLRGSYHLYQGFGPFIGNVAMGILFGWFYHRFGRVMPLVITHLLLDVLSFVGYPLAVVWWPEIFGAPGS